MSTTNTAAVRQRAVELDQPTFDDAFDLAAKFEQWLGDCQKISTAASDASNGDDSSEIYIGSFPGSNCEVSFEGTLRFDGYSIGNITSADGTLVLTERGRIEADIDVGTAIINGSVTGNILARERVVLESNAKVTGQIHTRALSIRLGAIFDGDCFFLQFADFPDAFTLEEESEELPELLVRV